jgi:hypothetical protein
MTIPAYVIELILEAGYGCLGWDFTPDKATARANWLRERYSMRPGFVAIRVRLTYRKLGEGE